MQIRAFVTSGHPANAVATAGFRLRLDVVPLESDTWRTLHESRANRANLMYVKIAVEFISEVLAEDHRRRKQIKKEVDLDHS